jgi:hypothetical protein
MAYLAYLVRKSDNLTAETRRRRAFCHDRSPKNTKKEVVWGRAVPTPIGAATACRQREWDEGFNAKGMR